MLDYGPVDCFYGTLEAMQKSWINPEKLLMKFLDLQIVNESPLTYLAHSSVFATLVCGEITALMCSQKDSGSACQMSYESVDIEQQLCSLCGSTANIDPQEKPFHTVIQPLYEKCSTDEELGYLYDI